MAGQKQIQKNFCFVIEENLSFVILLTLMSLVRTRLYLVLMLLSLVKTRLKKTGGFHI